MTEKNFNHPRIRLPDFLCFVPKKSDKNNPNRLSTRENGLNNILLHHQKKSPTVCGTPKSLVNDTFSDVKFYGWHEPARLPMPPKKLINTSSQPTRQKFFRVHKIALNPLGIGT